MTQHVRSWNVVPKTPVITVFTDRKNGVVESGAPSLLNLDSNIGEISWNRTPGYKLAAKLNILPNNPWRMKRLTQKITGRWNYSRVAYNPDGSLVWDYEYDRNGPADSYIYAPISLELSDRDITVTNDVAVTKVLLDMKDTKVNLAQMYAERKQTGNLFETNVRRICVAVTNLRRGNMNAARRALGLNASPRAHRKYVKKHKKNPSVATANGFLELQYGWRPLLSDIYGSAELIAEKYHGQPKTRVEKRQTLYRTGKSSFSPEPLLTVVVNAERKYSVKYVLYYSAQSEIHTLSEVGITNPALLAWELLPWSFVVDWLLPVGNYLSSLDASLGLSFEKGTKTIANEYNCIMTHEGSSQFDSDGKGYAKLTDTSVTVLRDFEVSRLPLSGFPSAAPPSFKNPFSPEHLANLTALLRTTFRR